MPPMITSSLSMTLLAVAVGTFVVDDNVVGVVAVLLLCWFIQVNGIGSLERVKGKVVRYWCVGVDLPVGALVLL